MKMEHIMHAQLTGHFPSHPVTPIIEIARNDQRCIGRNPVAHILDQSHGLRAFAFGEQAEMRTYAMHAPPVKIDFAMQQPAAFKAMRGNIHVKRLQNWKAAEYRVAMMSRLIHRILAIDGMQPDFFRDELMLRAARIVMKTLGMARMFALHFLQK